MNALLHSRVGSVCSSMVVLLLVSGLHAQTPTVTDTAKPNSKAAMDGDCYSCHTCAKPTSESPCLRACQRNKPGTIEREFAGKTGPNVVILDDLENLYLPVPFDHKGHSEMAGMTSGCVTCHHYTPEGTEHPACKTCHEVAPARENIRKPGLKGAYHRQCLACHREWSHETGCAMCHQPKTGVTDGSSVHPTPGDIVGQMHPPIPEPDTEVYNAPSADSGAHVIFRHREHIHRFGLRCVECHREDNCSRCHEVGRRHEQRTVSPAEHHEPCRQCHMSDTTKPDGRCNQCHWKTGDPTPLTFDHATTGWKLSSYHADLSCRQCHESVPFAKLDRTCDACHSGWNQTTFNHGLTGQQLDATHRQFDCDNCHKDRAFDAPPTCTECHDEEDGISYPARRPGPRTRLGLTEEPPHKVTDG